MAHPVRLDGMKGLVAGIANEHSIAYGCAKTMHDAGADLAITYRNEKAEPYGRPLAESLDSSIIVPCDLRIDEATGFGLARCVASVPGRAA